MTAAVPVLTALSHTSCSGNTSLTACPPNGIGTLTITGMYFYGPLETIRVNLGCVGALTINANNTQITCNLAIGSGGSVTPNLVVSTNGGNTSVNTGFNIHYGNALPRCSCYNFVCVFVTVLTVGVCVIAGAIVACVPFCCCAQPLCQRCLDCHIPYVLVLCF